MLWQAVKLLTPICFPVLGTGKTSMARILAKALNCEQGPTAEPCGQCGNCQRIVQGTSLDVIEIDAASNTSVDNIRDLREQVAFTPAESRYKVYIIDEVHMLSTGAFNALLKTLEEPPAHAVFILRRRTCRRCLQRFSRVASVLNFAE